MENGFRLGPVAHVRVLTYGAVFLEQVIVLATEIARELVITVGTVKQHTNSIYGKLGVGDRRLAVARARSLGLLPHWVRRG